MNGTAATTRIGPAAHLRQPASLPSQAQRKKGSVTAKLRPQVLVNVNGADGRGATYPRTTWSCAACGWTIERISWNFVSAAGSTSSASDLNSKYGATTPSTPPNVTVTNRHATMRITRVVLISRRVLTTYSSTTVIETYQISR